MNKSLLFIMIIFFSLADRAYGYEIVVLKSSTSKINQRIQDIFTDEINKLPHRGLKSIQSHQVTEVVITENEEISISRIQSTHPDLILALGAKALKMAFLVPDIPIVHLLVVNPEKNIDKTRSVSGVSLSVPPKVQLNEMKRYFPQVKRVGLVYDPKRSYKFIEQLDAVRLDLEFITLPTEKMAAVPGLIDSLRERVDLLWMLPDLTTTNKVTTQSYVLFSIKNKIPLLTFSKKLLKHGATIAVTFDTNEMAKQAADLAMDMLFHRAGAEPATLVAPRVQTIVNRKMARKLGIPIANGR